MIAPPPKPLINPRRIVLTVIVIGALVAIGYAFTLARTQDQQPVVRDAAVLSVQPEPSAHVVRQTTISYQLDAAYQGVLLVDGIEIPPGQLNPTSLTNQIAYTPGQGKATGVLAAGQHCASAQFWLRTQSRAQSRSYGWCFFTE